MPDLRNWLNACGLEPLAGVLAANDVDLDILPDLTEQDLEKLGISLGHRRKLLRAVATLRETPAGAAVAADAAPPRESAVPAGAPEAQRRQVTVLFSDLVGSTALATALDPEDMSGLIRRYQDACAGAVARFDGYIAKFMGDGVLAYFGYPQAREDAAERSVRAALAIVEAVRQIKRPDGVPLETRVGIATGLVVVGDIVGTGAAREEAIVGETPNLAARLQTLAEPNTVLVSEATLPPARADIRMRRPRRACAQGLRQAGTGIADRAGGAGRRAASRRRGPVSARSSAGCRKWACSWSAGTWPSKARAMPSSSPPNPAWASRGWSKRCSSASAANRTGGS